MPVSALSFLRVYQKEKRFITDYRKKNGISVPGHKTFPSKNKVPCSIPAESHIFIIKQIASLCHSCSWHVAPVMWHHCVVTGRLKNGFFNASTGKNLYNKKLARNLGPSNQPL